MNDIDLFRTRAERFGRLLTAAEGRWESPTPCSDWTVADLVNHVIGSERDFLQRHELLSGDAPSGSPDQAWAGHLTQTLDVLSAAGVADRPFDGYFGPTTVGATMADFYGWDLAVHGWDVARATGQPDPITDVEAIDLDRTTQGWGPALYSEGVCQSAIAVPDDAGSLVRLLGKLGRDPEWTPPAE